MELFNKDGKLFNIPTDTYIINKGSFGTVRELDKHTCVKFFDYETNSDTKLLEELKNIKLHHFDALQEILYDKEGKLQAYIMPIYNRILPDYYIMSGKEFVTAFKSLYKDFLELTERKIYPDDAKVKNAMSYKKCLKLTDYDLYYYSKSPKLLYYNVGVLLRLWMEIFLVQKVRNNYTDIVDDNDIYYLFNPDEYQVDDVFDIMDKLKDKKMVIDYFTEINHGKH